MCGISGWFAWGNARPNVDTIKGLLLANQERGQSAAGMAWQVGEELIVRKSKGPAQDLIRATPNGIFEEVAQSPRALLHARATTKGSEDKNENNHPVMGLGWLVVHNGSIGNDDDLWGFYAKKQNAERFAEVDTSAVPLVLSRGSSIEDSIRHLSLLSGSATIAAWSEADTKRIVLGRFGHNDLHLFYDPWDNILYWSSAPSAGYVLPGLVMGRHKFLTMSRLADQHVLLLSPEGMKAARAFKLKQSPFFAARRVAPVATTATPSTTTAVASPSSPSPTAGTGGSKEDSTTGMTILRDPRVRKGLLPNHQAFVDIGPSRIKVVFRANQDHLALAALWERPEKEDYKPFPLTDSFSRMWWNLQPLQETVCGPGPVLQLVKDTPYGRWVLKRNEKDHTKMDMEFLGHKRVKAWWDRLYRSRFFFPLELDSAGRTELDEHMPWEHYDIELLATDKASRRYLGFMCPWCGVWMSSTKVAKLNNRCEFCCVRSRIGAVP